MTKKQEMKIVYVEVDKIIPYEKNAKKHDDTQVEKVANSIREFGFAQPLVVDKENKLVIGHCRLESAKILGMKEVPVFIAEHLTKKQIDALRIADNKLNESPWDMRLLKEELKTFDLEMLDLTGFDRDIILDEDNEKDDEVPPVPDEPESKLGEIYQLGEHRLMCGDSTDQEDVAKLMDGKLADMVFTDPPYNVNYKGIGKQTSEGIKNDHISNSEFQKFLDKVFVNYRDNLKKGGGMYVFHSSSSQSKFENAIQSANFKIKNQLIWNKPTAAMGWGDYRWKHEPFFYCARKGESANFYGDRTNTTIWNFPKEDEAALEYLKMIREAEKKGKTSIWTMKRDSVNQYVHPTQKPVELITYAIFNSTKTQDIVMDLFGGSGSTLIAAQKTGRICYSMEIDPKYVDVILKRYEEYTGEKPKKLN